MKVLLIGEYFSPNLGDPVLCQTVEQTILQHYPNAVITAFDLSGRQSPTGIKTTTEYPNRYKLLLHANYSIPQLYQFTSIGKSIQYDTDRFVKAMNLLDIALDTESFDIAIFAGGSIFMDYFAGVIHGIILRLNKKKIPVIFHACGMSKIANYSKDVFLSSLKRKVVKSISLRDSKCQFVDLFAIRKPVIDTYDTALACSDFFTPSHTIDAEIGVGVIGIMKYYECQKELIQSFLHSNYDWKLFTNGSASDRLMAEKILDDLKLSETEKNKYIVTNPQSADDLVKIITSFNKIISYRLHSQIVAASFGIPSFGFVWNDKVREFHKKIGDICYQSPFDPYSLNELIHVIDNSNVDLKSKAFYAGKRSQALLIDQINHYSGNNKI